LRALTSTAIAVLILLLTRVIGVVRDILISATYGLTKVTDLFFQTTFFPTYILNIYNGPFSTAFVASLNHQPKSHRPFYVLRYRRISVLTGLALSIIYFSGSILVAYLNGRISPHEILLTCAILTPSCVAMAILGYGVSVANAFGLVTRAVTLLTVSNVIFVAGVILIWFGGRPNEIWFLQLTFTVSSTAAAGFAWVSINQIVARLPNSTASYTAPNVAFAALPGFRRALGLALAESSAFIVTQLAVLVMASHEGVGWASAATLAQRICFTALSLVIMPISSKATIAVINDRKAPHKLFGVIVMAVFVAFSGGACVLVLLGPWVINWAAGTEKISYTAANQIAQLIPPFAVWMVAMALNGMISRLLFGLKLGGMYVTTTIVAYIIANGVRALANIRFDFPVAIALGAFVELVVVVILSGYAFMVLHRKAASEKNETKPGYGVP